MSDQRYDLRDYDPVRDRETTHRIWQETGWIDDDKKDAMDAFIKSSTNSLVGDIKGEAECIVLTASGNMRYQEDELKLSGITSVATSRLARKRGLAGKLTALGVARDADNGAEVSALGIFDQGFYNRLGFGTGSYEVWHSFDPRTLKIPLEPDIPERFTLEHWKEIHESRKQRMRGHGGCNFDTPEVTRSDMEFAKKSFVLGYSSGDSITHHMFVRVRNVDDGPYSIGWMAYRTMEQFLELMALIKSLEDQVKLVHMREPPGVQLQDLLQRPFRYRQTTARSKFENKTSTDAYWQLRILDLERCVERTRVGPGTVDFNLQLHDPIEGLLEGDTHWKGINGDYVVRFGAESSVEKGTKGSLPILKASVGAFSRLWLGVRPASTLAATDDLRGPVSLLKELDRLLRLPQPHIDWDF